MKELKEQPFVIFNQTQFPYDNLEAEDQFEAFFRQICGRLKVDPDEISVKFFDDFNTQKWTTWAPSGSINHALGLFSQSPSIHGKLYKVSLSRSTFEHPELLVSTLVHELMHVKLLGGRYVRQGDPNMEEWTDLACFWFGFGIIQANSNIIREDGSISKAGYLPLPIISYANALVAYISQCDINQYYPVMNTNTSDLFRQDYTFLIETNDTHLTPGQVLIHDRNYQLWDRYNQAYRERRFEDAIDIVQQQVSLNPTEWTYYNNWGYALQSEKRYTEAIEQYMAGIKFAPGEAYLFNNRGYCFLQLGNLDDAHNDLYHSHEMDSANAENYRNIGAYYLRIGEVATALECFKDAQKLDRKCNLIHFYLSHAHFQLGNLERAKEHKSLSIEHKEHNDSLNTWWEEAKS